MSGEVEVQMEKGCPQGSSPITSLWNIVMQGGSRRWSRQANENWRVDQGKERRYEKQNELVMAQAYADNLPVVISG